MWWCHLKCSCQRNPGCYLLHHHSDGTPDTSHTKQIAFVIRFLLYERETNRWQIKKRFLYVEAFEKNKGVDITKLITDVIARLGLDIRNCRGQGYDSGSNTPGAYKGAQTFIKQNHSEALYVPCSAYSLNLAGVHSVESAIDNHERDLVSFSFLVRNGTSREKREIENSCEK